MIVEAGRLEEVELGLERGDDDVVVSRRGEKVEVSLSRDEEVGLASCRFVLVERRLVVETLSG